MSLNCILDCILTVYSAWIAMACAVRSTASVRCLCVGLFLQFCLHLGEAQCDTYHIQCRDVVQALGGIIQCPRILWGGANMVALCNGTSGTRKAVRMSLLANTDKQDQYFIRLGDMLSNAATEGPPIKKFLALFKAASEEGLQDRRLVRESEYDGEAKWRDEFQLRPLVFPPAMPTAACKLCVPLENAMPVFDQSGNLIAEMKHEIIIGVNVMKEVLGSVEDVLSFLSRVDLLILLVGYHCDLRLMAKRGHLHDAHSGNVLVIVGDDHRSDHHVDFRWHDFGESYDITDHPPERRSELRDHVQAFTTRIVMAMNSTAPGLAVELKSAAFLCFKVEVFTYNIGSMLECLGQRALQFATTIVKSHNLDTQQKRKFLEKVSSGFAESEMTSLWRDYFSSGRSFVSFWLAVRWVRWKWDKISLVFESANQQFANSLFSHLCVLLCVFNVGIFGALERCSGTSTSPKPVWVRQVQEDTRQSTCHCWRIDYLCRFM